MEQEPTSTIVVVDDDSIARTLLSSALEDAGLAVRAAASGRELFEVLQQHRADAVLLDLQMPGMDGFEVLGRLKADEAWRDLPVVVVSAAGDMENVVKSFELGAIDHISKPFDAVLVRARVRAALAIGRATAASEQQRCVEAAATAAPVPGGAPPGRAVAGFFRCLWRWVRPFKKEGVLYALGLVVSMSITSALPIGFKLLTDRALIPRDLQALIVILAVLAAAELISAGADLARDHYFARITAKLLNDIRLRMFQHLQRLSMSFHGRMSSAEISCRFSTDLAAVDGALTTGLSSVLCQSVVVPVTIVLLLALEWRLALLSSIGLLLAYRLEGRIEPRAEKAGHALRREQARVVSVLEEAVRVRSVVKVFRLEPLLIERFKRQLVGFFHTAYDACFYSYLVYRLPNRCVSLFGLLVMGAGALLVYEGDLTVGTLLSFQLLLTGLVSSVSDLTWVLPSLLQAAVSMERVDALLNERPEVTDIAGAARLPRPERRIELEDVRFGYSGDRLQLDGVSLSIPVNRSVLLVGPSGSGKSTVLNLLMRFYDPTSGRITVDGQDIRSVTLESLRSQMGVVFQDHLLFDATVRENIRMGNLTATDEETIEAAKAAGIHDAILAMPEGYDTQIGESGGKLSGGQRQRIAIARAVVANPSILLLDEATSALDACTAARVNEMLQRIGRGRTVISVTHQLETAPSADLVFVFREGRVVERGTHEELLRLEGWYAELWRKQTGFTYGPGGDEAHVTAARLAAVPLLAGLDEAGRSRLADLFVTERLPPERIVVQQGDPGDKFYIIARGRVAVTRETPSGEVQVAVMEAGDHFGEVALVKKIPRVATVRTLTDCTLLALPREHFLRLLESNAAVRESVERVSQDRGWAER